MGLSWKPTFFRIYIGQAFSLVSSSSVQFAIIWWITIETGSAIALTAASLAGLLPQVLIGPFAGVWIDRYSRKTILILADAATAVASAILGLSFLFTTPPLWFVYLILFLRAVGETFHKPAMQSAIPQLVPAEGLTRAGGLGQMINAACNMAGPMLGALLMSVTTMPFVMLVDLVGGVLAVLTLSAVRLGRPEAGAAEKPRLLADLKQGFRAIREDPALLRAAIPVFITAVVFLPLGSLLPLMVSGYFLVGAWQNGIVKTLFSLGMLLSALVIGVTGGLKRQFLMISLSSLLLGVCSLIAGLLPASAFWLFCALVFVMGTTGMMGNVPFTAYIQRSISKENHGKVLSLVHSAISLGVPLGMMIAGPVTEAIGINRWLVGVGVLMLGVGTISYLLTREM